MRSHTVSRKLIMMCDASEMLAAALEQMDGIIAGSKAMNYTNGLFDCQSPTSPFLGSLRVLHLLEDLRAALDLMDPEEKESLRSQVSETTAEGLMEWLQSRLTNGHGSAAGDLVNQERLTRLESDKECLVLQELLSRSALETEKLELLTEVSSLKLKLAAAEGDCRESEGLYQDVKDMRLQLTSMEDERQEYERSLNAAKVRVPHGQEELISLQKQLEEREQALRRFQDQAMSEAPNTEQSQSREKDMEVQTMRSAVESLKAANEEKDLKIKELQNSLIRFKRVQDMVLSVQASKDKPRDEDTREGLCDTEMVSTGGTEETDEPQLIPCSELLPEVTTHKPAAETTDSVSEVQQPERSRLTSNNEDQASKNGGSPSISPTQPSSGGNESFGSKKTRSSFGRGFFKIRGNKMTSTSPNMIEGERKGTEHLDLAGVQTQKPKALETHSPEGKKKSKGIMKLFGRMKRSQSTSDDLDDSPESAFRRGGVRATAGPRLGWSRDLQRSNNNELDSPFSRWSKEQVCEWLQNQGLDLTWASGILYTERNCSWLFSRWAPRRKMPWDDLLGLKVGSVLHHLSIKRAIQVLRINCYDPSCLRRRPTENNPTPAEICQWTNHRVMEWLRSVDLAEYAPNLRGSGVHGGLMVLEPRFNVETMALLLNIPPNKTLLRRHLATNFHLLVGSEAQRLKQEYLENPDYTVLTATAKVKATKTSVIWKFWDIEAKATGRDGRMEDSEGTVQQIGAFSEGINNLTSMLKEDEFFMEASSCSPETSAIDDN
ncbi:hypothetical protein cypCar_00014155 [Cyprinus carpio]|nr:hypothetical protein cypCar_00014155 [Cyprinus carpio]